MFNFINKKEDNIPSKRRLWAWVQNFLYQLNNKIINIKNLNNINNIFVILILLLNLIYPQHINADNLIVNKIINNSNNLNENKININLTNKELLLNYNHYSSIPVFEYNINNSILNQPKLTYNSNKNYNSNNNEKIVKKINLWITAYSSSPDETDDDPFITASGSLTRDGVAATNILPFGTKIQIPSLFGNKIFTIEDRMHQRKTNFIDIWMESKEKALQFGIHYAEVIILEDQIDFAKN